MYSIQHYRIKHCKGLFSESADNTAPYIWLSKNDTKTRYYGGITMGILRLAEALGVGSPGAEAHEAADAGAP